MTNSLINPVTTKVVYNSEKLAFTFTNLYTRCTQIWFITTNKLKLKD